MSPGSTHPRREFSRLIRVLASDMKKGNGMSVAIRTSGFAAVLSYGAASMLKNLAFGV